MRTFKLAPEGFKEVRLKIITRIVPVVLLVCGFAIFFSSTHSNTDSSSIYSSLLMIPFVLIAIGYAFISIIKRQRKQWETFELTIDGETISRTLHNVPAVVIKKSELQEIHEFPQGHILLKQVKGILSLTSLQLSKTETNCY